MPDPPGAEIERLGGWAQVKAADYANPPLLVATLHLDLDPPRIVLVDVVGAPVILNAILNDEHFGARVQDVRICLVWTSIFRDRYLARSAQFFIRVRRDDGCASGRQHH